MGCLYSFIQYSDNYANTTESLYHYKRPEQNRNVNNTIVDLNINDSTYLNISQA